MPGADEFIRRTTQLSDEVGTGPITAGILVDQAYAQNQHENLEFQHRTGGRAHYLGAPLLENLTETMIGLSRSIITEEGSGLMDEMREIADRLNDYVKINAPRDPDIGDVLALSGSQYVTDNGTEVYRRAPLVVRRPGQAPSGWDD